MTRLIRFGEVWGEVENLFLRCLRNCGSSGHAIVSSATSTPAVFLVYTLTVDFVPSPPPSNPRHTSALAGLAESSEYHVEHPEQVRDQRERGILVQCVSSYATLEDRYPGVQDTQESGGFGENMVVDGLDVNTVCIGDRFEVIQNDGTPRSVAFVVTSPRRPCGSVDFTHGKMHRKGGVRDACASGGLGGFFFRAVRQDEDALQDADYSVVLGEIAVGDRLIRAVHNYPQWSVQRVSSALYAGWSEGVPYKLWYDTDQWANVEVPLSNDELAELVSIEDLAEEEWRDQVRLGVLYRRKVLFLTRRSLQSRSESFKSSGQNKDGHLTLLVAPFEKHLGGDGNRHSVHVRFKFYFLV